jgi:hypothetical protein
MDAPKEDDHIIHLKRNGDSYLWVYSDKCNNVQAVWLNEREDVFHNLKSILKLLTWDREPYYGIQVFAPGFPTVMIHLSDALDSFKNIKSVLNRVFDNWPENKPLASLPHLATDEIYEKEQEDDEEEDDEEEDDDTMPPLVRISSCPCPCPCTPNRPSRKTECPPAPSRPAKSVRAEDDAPASNTRSKKPRLDESAEKSFYSFWN